MTSKLLIEQAMTLLEALQKLSPDSSKSNLRSWIKQGRVFVDNVPATRGDQPVRQGQTLSLGSTRKPLPQGLHILYEDDHLIAVDKPTGLLSVATAFETELTAHAILKDHFRPRKVDVVHRLDQDTSGVMLFALSSDAWTNLKKVFEEHTLERLYVAIVEGQMPQRSGTWESRLIEDSNYVVRSSRDELVGKPAVTHFHCTATSRRYSWLELTLETGRKNQIRVHCRDAGFPVVGDKKYGATSNPLKRLCLHSHRIAIPHPITGKSMVFVSPIPQSFFTLLKPGDHHVQ